ncbi:MAG: cupredoxin domain-containing protein [Bacteroidetes bacterium]|nr:cupredoxin domain-containing protein [Bacteroidota bacterium]
MKKKLITTFTSTCFVFMLTGIMSCKKTDSGTPGENEIFLLYKRFNPTSLTIKKGTTVTFTNKDNANHSASSNINLFDSGKIKNNQSFTHTFNDVGTYNFYCNYHSTNQQEQGTIIVQ